MERTAIAALSGSQPDAAALVRSQRALKLALAEFYRLPREYRALFWRCTKCGLAGEVKVRGSFVNAARRAHVAARKLAGMRDGRKCGYAVLRFRVEARS